MQIVINKNTSIPVYVQLADYLREQILTGVYKHGFRFPAESSFSSNLGINHQTLRKSFRILAEENLISQKRGKGTFVTYNGESIYKIALLGYSVNSTYGALGFSALSKALSQIRHEIIPLPFIPDDKINLKNLFCQSKANALILHAQSKEVLAQLADDFFASIPVVVINAKASEAKNCYCVDVLPNPLRPAIEHLAKLGHKRIGFITRFDKTSNLLEREKSFWTSLKEFNLDCSSELMVSSYGTHFEASMECALKLMQNSNPVTAIICPGPIMTNGALYGLMKAGYKIPEDVSLIGYDISSNFNPYISTLLQPQYEMACWGGKILIDILNKRNIENMETFQVQFEDRGSTSKPKRIY